MYFLFKKGESKEDLLCVSLRRRILFPIRQTMRINCLELCVEGRRYCFGRLFDIILKLLINLNFYFLWIINNDERNDVQGNLEQLSYN